MELQDIVNMMSDRECRTTLLQIAKSYENYPSYLSEKSDYARGYKNAWYMAYDKIREFIKLN